MFWWLKCWWGWKKLFSPCGYGEKLKRLQIYVCKTFGKHFVLFNFFFFFFFFFFTDNFAGSKDTEPYKTDVSFLCQYIISTCTHDPHWAPYSPTWLILWVFESPCGIRMGPYGVRSTDHWSYGCFQASKLYYTHSWTYRTSRVNIRLPKSYGHRDTCRSHVT